MMLGGGAVLPVVLASQSVSVFSLCRFSGVEGSDNNTQWDTSTGAHITSEGKQV